MPVLAGRLVSYIQIRHFEEHRISSIASCPRIENALELKLRRKNYLTNSFSEFSRLKMVDGSIQIIYFVFTKFELKNMNFEAFFLRIIFGDHLRLDKWKKLSKRQNIEIIKVKQKPRQITEVFSLRFYFSKKKPTFIVIFFSFFKDRNELSTFPPCILF